VSHGVKNFYLKKIYSASKQCNGQKLLLVIVVFVLGTTCKKIVAMLSLNVIIIIHSTTYSAGKFFLRENSATLVAITHSQYQMYWQCIGRAMSFSITTFIFKQQQ
jgi:hypothetical protein